MNKPWRRRRDERRSFRPLVRFHSAVLFDALGSRRRTRKRPSLLYCGNDDDAKANAECLIRDAGFQPVDASPLRTGEIPRAVTLAIAQLAYEGDGGPRLAYRIEKFGR